MVELYRIGTSHSKPLKNHAPDEGSVDAGVQGACRVRNGSSFLCFIYSVVSIIVICEMGELILITLYQNLLLEARPGLARLAMAWPGWLWPGLSRLKPGRLKKLEAVAQKRHACPALQQPGEALKYGYVVP
jgi:hypothetical protein